MLLISAAMALAMQSAPVPDRVELRIPSGACQVLLDGKSVSFARLRTVADSWRSAEPEVHFMPDPSARYACVDRVLRVLRSAHVTKLGFIGNEQAPETPQ